MTASLGPHLTVAELLAEVGRIAFRVVALEVHSDASVGILESQAVHDHNEDEEDGEGDGYPNDIRGGVDTFPHDEVDDDPDGERGQVDFPAEDGRVSDHRLRVHVRTILIDRLRNVSVEYSVSNKSYGLDIIQ